jgi:hypothetical protein
MNNFYFIFLGEFFPDFDLGKIFFMENMAQIH